MTNLNYKHKLFQFYILILLFLPPYTIYEYAKNSSAIKNKEKTYAIMYIYSHRTYILFQNVLCMKLQNAFSY